MFRLVPRSIRWSGPSAVAAALVLAMVVAAFDVVPVKSQVPRLDALEAPAPVPLDAPWDPVWDASRSQDVPLSAQNIAPPFGGGTVQAVTVRALHDGERLYLLLEWADGEPNDAVNGLEEFSDAAAVQFPAAAADALPPFTMGGTGTPVNIWQWKAVWQADIEGGFTTSRDRYPNTYVDDAPDADDALYRPAAYVGNPLAQRDHESPVENLIAEGFGTLTHADVQDVAGSGEWREGRWRALFVRSLEPADDAQATFDVGTATNIAFAVWDGGSGDRNGVKSIAPFIELGVGEGATLPAPGARAAEFGGTQVLIIVVMVAAAAAGASLVFISRRRQPDG